MTRSTTASDSAGSPEHRHDAPDEATAARSLLTATAVRERASELAEIADRDGLEHFRMCPERLDATADFVAAVTRERHPDLRIGLHSRWRHFEVDGIDRWDALARRHPAADLAARARARIDLAVASVLLDAGAGATWHYREAASGREYRRSEGLAIASLEMFAAGLFSADRDDPLRVDAAALETLDGQRLASALQVGASNPLAGLDGRAALLRALAGALRARPDLFGDPPRPGHLFDTLRARATGDGVGAGSVLDALLDGLGPIWPGRITLGGVALGDCWPHPAIRRADETDGLLPLHKLSQWLAYSLVEPLEDAGLAVTALDGLTGLAEYRNGGLMIDLGLVEARDPGLLERPQPATSEAVVEWRGLTVALLDRLAPLVRDRLGVDRAAMPLGCVLEGGTWAAGRAAAAARRPGAEPPIRVVSDGTLF